MHPAPLYWLISLSVVISVTIGVTLAVGRLTQWRRTALVLTIGSLAAPCVISSLFLYYWLKWLICNGLASCLVSGLVAGIFLETLILTAPLSLAASFCVLKLFGRKKWSAE